MAIGCQLVYHDIWLSGVLFSAMLINSINAGLSGVLIPLGLEKVNITPKPGAINGMESDDGNTGIHISWFQAAVPNGHGKLRQAKGTLLG